MERTLVEAIRNDLIEFVLFSHQCILKQGAVKLSISQMLFQSNSCSVGVNLLQLCFTNVSKLYCLSEICPKRVKKGPKIIRGECGITIGKCLLQWKLELNTCLVTHVS